MFPNAWERAANILPGIFSLAAGEGISRLSNLLLLIYVSHHFGVRTTGVFALAQALALYLMLGIDLGFRHIGARLIASDSSHANAIAQRVQKKRLLTMVVVVSGGVLYGCFGPLPTEARQLVSLFSLSMAGYAFSLDWVAWGLKQFHWMSFWRACASVLACSISIGLIFYLHFDILATALGNAMGYASAAFLLWLFWWRRSRSRRNTSEPSELIIRKEINWRSAIWMGLALLSNQAFNNIDLFLLGAYSNSRSVGLYNAAYRMILIILAVYYLLTQSLFPTLAERPSHLRTLRSIQTQLLFLFLIGFILACALSLVGPHLLLLLYGRDFSAANGILRLLVVVLPLDFVTSFLCNAMVAWGYSRKVLACTVTALVANVALNLRLIPRGQALGAAWATDLSYIVLLSMMIAMLTGRKRLASPTAAMSEV